MERTQQTAYNAGPSLLALAIVYTLLIAASILSGLLLKHGLAVVNPYSSAEEARRFFAGNPVALRVSSFFLFWIFGALRNLRGDSGQPLALSRRKGCGYLTSR